MIGDSLEFRNSNVGGNIIAPYAWKVKPTLASVQGKAALRSKALRSHDLPPKTLTHFGHGGIDQVNRSCQGAKLEMTIWLTLTG